MPGAFGTIGAIKGSLKSHNDHGINLSFKTTDSGTGHTMGASVSQGKGNVKTGMNLFGGKVGFGLNLDGSWSNSFSRKGRVMNQDVNWSLSQSGDEMFCNSLDRNVALGLSTSCSKNIMGRDTQFNFNKNFKFRASRKGVSFQSATAKVDMNRKNMGLSFNLQYNKQKVKAVEGEDGKEKKKTRYRFACNRVGFWRQQDNNKLAFDSQWDKNQLQGFQVYGSTKLDDKWQVGFMFQPSMKEQDVKMQIGFEGEVYDKTSVKASVNTNSQATVSLIHHPNQNIDLAMTNTFDLQQDWKDAFNPGFSINLKS